MTLKRQVFIASLWSLIGNGGRQLITFLLFIYVARKVSPTDLGLVAFAMIFVDVLGYVARLGQVEALQRQAEISDRAISTSFWMLVVTGVFVTSIIMALAERLGSLWNEAAFGGVLLLLAPICMLQALNAVPEALLKRHFQYRSLAIRSWLATLSGGLLGAYLAFNEFGVYALVGQRLATTTIQTVAAWALLGWRPRLTFERAVARLLGRTGIGISLAGFSGNVNARIADGIAGMMLGATTLGFLRLGWRFYDFIVQLAVNPVSNVALGTFSRMQDDLSAIRRAYLRLAQVMALASLPMFFGIAAVADVFIPLALGSKWANSIAVIQVLCLMILAGTVNSFFASAMIAVGKVNIVARQSTVQVLATALLVFLGAHFGMVGVLAAVVVRAISVAIYNVATLKREIGLPVLSLIQVLTPPTVACLIMVGVVEVAKFELPQEMNKFMFLTALCTFGALTYATVLFLGDVVGLWRGYLRDVLESLATAAGRQASMTVTPA